jgi:hypothetical protein
MVFIVPFQGCKRVQSKICDHRRFSRKSIDYFIDVLLQNKTQVCFSFYCNVPIYESYTVVYGLELENKTKGCYIDTCTIFDLSCMDLFEWKTIDRVEKRYIRSDYS